MAVDLVSKIRQQLKKSVLAETEKFEILRAIGMLLNRDEESTTAQELVLRVLEKREQFGQLAPVLDGLVRQVGLFPYLHPDTLGLTDLLAYEVHRPDNLGEVVFHRAQAAVYHQLMEGRNVILSAPTSFGKSLIIDAVIASGKYKNIAVIVPTIALIDETRRRLFTRFGDAYKLITHPSQAIGDRNIYVLTQERLLELPHRDIVQFFVIDEFYKLGLDIDPDRAILLNQAFYDLRKQGAQFYLLGPNIDGVSDTFPQKFEASFIKTDYSTVVSEVHALYVPKDARLERLLKLCKTLKGGTLVYCSSPASARTVASALIEAGVTTASPTLDDAANWIAENYHAEWTLTRGIAKRIGLHHGKVPRALGQYVVRAFNNEELEYLVCTSTLIEGVNTRAENVVVFDHKLATKNLDYFTFNNIKGRSGRMFQHFVGKVYVFSPPPTSNLPIVEIPLVNEDGGLPDSLLVHMDERDVPEKSAERYKDLVEQDDLEFEIIKENNGIDPEAQIRLAREISTRYAYYHRLLNWQRFPTKQQLYAVCDLIWSYLVAGGRRRSGVSSGKQLAFKLDRYRASPSMVSLIAHELKELEKSADEDAADSIFDLAVEEALDFYRYWVNFNAPRYLLVLDKIQKDVIGRRGLRPGDYRFFASQLENGFLPAGIAALDEYGVPTQVGEKLIEALGSADDIDITLSRLRQIELESVALSAFERALVEDTRGYI
jgi:hypothetical protein